MYPQTIDAKTKSVLEKIAESDFIHDFYLAGGTALAIHLGHRKSIDLDFFTANKFTIPDIKKILSDSGKFILDYEDGRTINGSLDGVKISFFHYDYRQLYPFVDFNGIKLADERDIAAMKIDAMSSRGTKKDFIDIYFLMKKYHLSELIAFFEKKFSTIEYNKTHILKSLVFFADAEKDAMPDMIQKTDWNSVKRAIGSAVNKLTL